MVTEITVDVVEIIMVTMADIMAEAIQMDTL